MFTIPKCVVSYCFDMFQPHFQNLEVQKRKSCPSWTIFEHFLWKPSKELGIARAKCLTMSCRNQSAIALKHRNDGTNMEKKHIPSTGLSFHVFHSHNFFPSMFYLAFHPFYHDFPTKWRHTFPQSNGIFDTPRTAYSMSLPLVTEKPAGR